MSKYYTERVYDTPVQSYRDVFIALKQNVLNSNNYDRLTKCHLLFE